jgi:hypothetical protein
VLCGNNGSSDDERKADELLGDGFIYGTLPLHGLPGQGSFYFINRSLSFRAT